MSAAPAEGTVLRAAARIALPPPLDGETAGSRDEDAGRVAAVLRINKVPLRHIPSVTVPETIAGAGAWREALGRETDEEEALRGELEPLCRDLASQGIVPVLFKSPGGVPYRSSNVDLLVAPRHRAAAAARLESGGHILLPHYREENKLLFHRFSGGKHAISVHLHTAVSWGRVMVLPGDEVAAGSRPSPAGSFHVASPRDLALATLAHALYETDEIRLNDLRILRLCAAAPGFDWEAVECRAQSGGWGRGLAAILLLAAEVERRLAGCSCVPGEVIARAERQVAGSPWAAIPWRAVRALPPDAAIPLPWRFSKLWSKAHFVHRLLTEPARAPEQRIEDLFATGWNLAANRLRLRARPASVIAISGLDGSGKSTVVADLRAALALCEVPVRVVWSRGGFSLLVSAMKKSARAALPSRIPAAGAHADKAAWLARPLPAAVFGALVAAEQAGRGWVQVGWRRRAGITVVCDRSAVDAAAELQSRRNRPEVPLAARALLALSPAPDLAVLLRLDPDAARARKPDDADPAELARRAAALDHLARERGLLVVDASRPRDAVIDEVVSRALRAAFGRFRGVA